MIFLQLLQILCQLVPGPGPSNDTKVWGWEWYQYHHTPTKRRSYRIIGFVSYHIFSLFYQSCITTVVFIVTHRGNPTAHNPIPQYRSWELALWQGRAVRAPFFPLGRPNSITRQRFTTWHRCCSTSKRFVSACRPGASRSATASKTCFWKAKSTRNHGVSQQKWGVPATFPWEKWSRSVHVLWIYDLYRFFGFLEFKRSNW